MYQKTVGRRGTLFCAVMVVAVAMWLVVGAKAQPASYGEAPMLADRVAAGELPPVAERLPREPVVVEPVERIGNYGGTWQTALTGPADTPWLGRTIGYENLVRVDPEWTAIIPNIAKSFEVNEDATEFIFHFHEGMKWSDGHPLTVDDLVFWYEAVFLNSDITPSKPSWLVVESKPAVVERLNDMTAVFRFAEPNGLFLTYLASTFGSGHAAPIPRHYLEQFHIEYNPEGVNALVEAAGVEDWVALWQRQASRWENPELPSFLAWVATTSLGEATTRFTAERNPYYWKVDPEGNQLPYLDQVRFEIIADSEVMLLRMLTGDINMHSRHFNTLDNRSVLVDNQDRGNYRFFELLSSRDNEIVISFNLTHRDPVRREIFQNKDFRIGLSHAINRQEIIDLVYVGQGTPAQVAPQPEAPFYHEQLATQYTEYDVELAHEYLDRAGYSEKDQGGYRLGPDGNRISFTVELFDRTDWVDTMELIEGYWREVGIDVQVRVMERSFFSTRMYSNEHDVAVWWGGGGLMDAFIDTRNFVPNSSDSPYAVLWAHWYSGGTPSEEPPEVVRHQLELYDQFKANAELDVQIGLMKQILDVAAEQFYNLGITLPPPGYGIVSNNFRNVPEQMYHAGWAYNDPAPTHPEQYFIEGETR